LIKKGKTGRYEFCVGSTNTRKKIVDMHVNVVR